MTKKLAQPERNRRVIRAPKEIPIDAGTGNARAAEDDKPGVESPAPPCVTSSGSNRRRASRVGRGDAWRTVGRVILTGLMLGGSGTAVVLATYRFAQSSPQFSVRQVDVDGLRRKSRESIMELGGIQAGKNIFSVETAAVERSILRDPWIRAVKVERRLPATIRVELTEREAGALAVLGEQMTVVSRSGEPFKKYEPSDPSDLPIITGVAVEEAGHDPALERRRLLLALDALRHFERSTLSRTYVTEELHLTPGGDVVLTVGKSGLELHLGAGPWAKKLVMAERVLAKLRGQKASVGAIFLDNRAHPERVVVRMRQ